jgi:hypothetical protein
LTTVMSSSSMNVATETASRVHHFLAISASFGRHIGRISFVTAMTDVELRT